MTATLIALAALTGLADVATPTDALCQTARVAVEQFAAAKGWQAEVHCRASVGGPTAVNAVLRAQPPAPDMVLRSGPTTWAVRVQAPRAAAYVQRVPLTITWIAPAWVANHDLSAGAVLQADDVELQTRRWSDGVPVIQAREEVRPAGRTRQLIRAGDVLTAAQLLSPDSLVRGDRVTAVLAEGGMEIRMPAQLLAAARVGERARIQVQGRPVALEGRLADAQTVKVDSE